MEDMEMYAATLTTDRPAPARVSSQVPYCFILDESFRVLLAGPAGGEEHFADLYDADSSIDSLPGPIDRVVRVLTAAWRSSSTPAPAAASVNNLKVTVAPLHGHSGRRIVVYVERGSAG